MSICVAVGVDQTRALKETAEEPLILSEARSALLMYPTLAATPGHASVNIHRDPNIVPNLQNKSAIEIHFKYRRPHYLSTEDSAHQCSSVSVVS